MAGLSDIWSAPNGILVNARWQQTYQVNFHCLRISENAHITENNGFYLLLQNAALFLLLLFLVAAALTGVVYNIIADILRG